MSRKIELTPGDTYKISGEEEIIEILNVSDNILSYKTVEAKPTKGRMIISYALKNLVPVELVEP